MVHLLVRCLAVVSQRCGTDRERGASAVEYGLLAAGITGAFVVGTAGFNGALAAVFHQALDAIPATTP
jgi:Flp pilus assembly pilin Flp